MSGVCELDRWTALAERSLRRLLHHRRADELQWHVQLVIGGRNKYLINGHVAQPRHAPSDLPCAVSGRGGTHSPCARSHTGYRMIFELQMILPRLHRLTSAPVPFACSRVQNLFHSVQLNVNNPHFLIMQGRITKVLAISLYAQQHCSWSRP